VTRIVLGRITGPFGVRGWVKLASYTDPPGQILQFPRWRAERPDGAMQELHPVEGRAHGKGWVARIAGVDDRDAALAIGKPELWVERDELPPLAAGQFYREDLLGFEVVNLEGLSLGRVEGFVDLPANAVMVVAGDKERWLPVGPGHLLRVDMGRRRVTVDWDPEF
jgi:16S rRNA processing protein RimM